MQALVGLDLRPNGRGALRLAAWLREALGPDARIDGLHIVEHLEETYAARLGLHPTVEIVRLTETAVREVLDEEGVAAVFSSVDVLPAATAEDALAHEALARTVDLLVIGRRAASDSRNPWRLGRVARRLLRSLPVPVVVAPPELRAHDLGPGPILSATDRRTCSVDAARFAATLATRLGRPWWLVHVARSLDDYGATFLPSPARDGAYQSYLSAEREHVQLWAREHGLLPDRIAIEQGAPAERLGALAIQHASPLVVVGSRRLAWQERIFRSSVADDLAGHATVPVVVVPPLELPA